MGMHGYGFERLHFTRLDPGESIARSAAFLDSMRMRRSVRMFSTDPVPFEVIQYAVAAAGTGPSGANQQPWRFVVVRDAAVKRRIRKAAEAEERESYQH